jgi:biotin-(acetyl-CoA carboxylase) ligase
MIRNAQRELRDYKKLTETYRAEVSNMDATLTQYIDDTPKSIMPPITELMVDLNEEMRSQRTSNEHFQKQITGLKKEKGGLQQHLISSNTRSQILEDSVGYSRSKY